MSFADDLKVIIENWKKEQHISGDSAEWKPLENLLPLEYCDGFMYMGKSGNVHLYKHGVTRKYLNMDDDGICYRYSPKGCDNMGIYLPIDELQAVLHVYKDIEQFGATPETKYNEAYKAGRDAALKEAGITSITA